MSLSAHLTPTPDVWFPVWHQRVVDAFVEVAAVSTESTPIDEVLRLIGRRMCELLDLSRCSVYLRREDGTFQGHVGYCAGGEPIDEGVSRLISGTEEDQFTAEILRSVSPVVLQDATKDPRPLRKAMRMWGVRDMVGVPLVVDEEVVGIIYVDNQGAGHRFTEHDLAVAQAFASMAALILRKSWDHSRLSSRVDEVERERMMLQVAGSVQSEITRSMVEGASEEEVIGTLANRLGNPVTLYDANLNVIGWAAPKDWGARAVETSTPQRMTTRFRDVRKKLAQGAAVVTLPASPGFKHRGMFVRLIAKGKHLGYLEVREMSRSFGATDAAALAHTSTSVALALTVSRARRTCRSDRINDVMSKIVQPHTDPEAIHDCFKEAGLELEGVRYGVVHLRLSADRPDLANISMTERREAVSAIVASKLPAPTGVELVATTSLDGALVMLYSAPREFGTDPVTEAVRSALPHLESMTGVLSAIVSDLYPDPIDLPGAVEDLFNSARVIKRSSNPHGVRRLNEMTIVQLIHQSDGLGGATRHAHRMIRPLRAYDAAHSGALVETLRAYVAADMNMRVAAHSLGVHENTIRYRLGRIHDISTIDPDKFDDLVRVRTAFQLLDLERPDIAASSQLDERSKPVVGASNRQLASPLRAHVSVIR